MASIKIAHILLNKLFIIEAIKNCSSKVRVIYYIRSRKVEFLGVIKIFGGELLNRKIVSSISLGVLLFSLLTISVPLALAVPPDQANGPPGHIDEPEAVIYVTSQGMYYHTIVPYAGGNLHWNGHNGGSFQPLDPTTSPASTPYGPGDVGYRGGRWWIDNLDPEEGMGTVGVQDEYDTYFLCPLLGPGMTELPT